MTRFRVSAAFAATITLVAGCATVAPSAATLRAGAFAAREAPTACTAEKPAAAPTKDLTQHGVYNNLTLPAGYEAFADEAEVTAAIKKLDAGPEWPCFQKFYAGASAVYKTKSEPTMAITNLKVGHLPVRCPCFELTGTMAGAALLIRFEGMPGGYKVTKATLAGKDMTAAERNKAGAALKTAAGEQGGMQADQLLDVAELLAAAK